MGRESWWPLRGGWPPPLLAPAAAIIPAEERSPPSSPCPSGPALRAFRLPGFRSWSVWQRGRCTAQAGSSPGRVVRRLCVVSVGQEGASGLEFRPARGRLAFRDDRLWGCVVIGAVGAAEAAGAAETRGVEVELTAGAVARRLGVAPSTLRSWARRYGLGPSGHQPGRYRRYGEQDLVALQWMCRLVGQGVAPAAAAALARAGGGQDAPASPRGDAERGLAGERELVAERRSRARTVRGVVEAAQRLDAEAVTTAVGRYLAGRGVVATWQELCRPVLAVLDRRVAETGGCVDAELVATWAISTALRSVVSEAPVTGPAAGVPVLLACTEGEQHTLAMEALHAALSEAGLPARMLGPSVPDSALAAACARTRPDTVVLWAQTRQTARPEVLDQLGGAAGCVLALGPGWVGLDPAELPETVATADDLPAALGYLVRRGERASLVH